MRRFFMGAICFLFTAAQISAADADAGKPYEFQVVVRIAKHRLLTPIFCRQLHDDLQDALQAALGPLAHVEVVDSEALPKDKWTDLASLDSQSELNALKRHFVQVNYNNGRFVVRARQFDGSTGLASPVVREASTADGKLVGRLATKFVEQDFGPVGTVVGYDKANDRVVLSFRAGAVGPVELARLVPSGSVFALSKMEGSPARGRRIDSAYLVTLAEPVNGRCECKFVYRYQNQLDDWSAAPFRAIRLGAANGPVRLRLLDRNGLPPKDLQVRISPDGFRSTDKIRDQGAARNGVFDTIHPYDRIAFAQIMSGEQKVAQIPVPVIDDRVITCRVTPSAGGEARQQLELDVASVYQRLLDIRRRLVQLGTRLETVVTAQKHREALEEVKRNLDLLDSELGAQLGELVRLRREAAGIESSAKPFLEQCDVFAADIRKRRDSLVSWQSKLEDAIKDETNQEPNRVSYLALAKRAETQMLDADFKGAIDTYEDMLKRFGDREEIRKKLADLQEKWKIKSDEHEQAREFAYGPWAGVKTMDDVRVNLPKARDALAACKRVGDRLTALKLLLASTGAGEVLAREIVAIKDSESEVDKINLPQLQKLNEDLQAFARDANTFVGQTNEKKD